MDRYADYIDEISRLLDKRAAVYPARDESTVQLREEIKRFGDDLLSSVPFDHFTPEKPILKNGERFAASPVFICGQMKSGTTLLTRLLDHHPDLLVMPGDSHYVNNRHRFKSRDLETVFQYWLRRMINPTGNHPFWFLGPEKESFDHFLCYLDHFLKKSDAPPFVAVVLATYAALNLDGQPALKKYWVEKTPLNEQHALKLGQEYANGRFLHILRDPLTNLASLKKLTGLRGRSATIWQHARATRKLFQLGRTNQQKLGQDRYHVLRYEDLIEDPQATMEAVCEFLQIEFDDSLLTPTENGRLTSPNSMFGQAQPEGTILNQSQSKRYVDVLSRREIEDIVTHLYDEALSFGYRWDADERQGYRQNKLTQGFRDLAAATGIIGNRLLDRFGSTRR